MIRAILLACGSAVCSRIDFVPERYIPFKARSVGGSPWERSIEDKRQSDRISKFHSFIIRFMMIYSDVIVFKFAIR